MRNSWLYVLLNSYACKKKKTIIQPNFEFIFIKVKEENGSYKVNYQYLSKHYSIGLFLSIMDVAVTVVIKTRIFQF